MLSQPMHEYTPKAPKQNEIQGGLDRILYLVSCISYPVSLQIGRTATAMPT